MDNPYSFMASVESQVYKDWEHVFNKRVVRRPAEISISLPEPVRNLIASLKRAL